MGVCASNYKMADRSTIEGQINSTKVIMYSKSSCPFCTTAKGVFAQMNVDYTLVELNQVPNGSAIQNTLAEITRQRTVPNIFIGGQHVGGCSELQAGVSNGSVQNKLEAAGVPFKS